MKCSCGSDHQKNPGVRHRRLPGTSKYRWLYRYSIGGKRRERQAPDERTAIEERLLADRAVRRGEDPERHQVERGSPTLVEVLREYLGQFIPSLPGRKSSKWEGLKRVQAFISMKAYDDRARQHFGATPISALTTAMMRDFVEALRPGRKNSTVNHHLDYIRAALNRWAEIHDAVLPGIRWSKIRYPNDDAPRDRRVTDPEVARITKALPPAYRPLPEFAVETGMRANEILGLDWSEVRAGERGGYFVDLPAARSKGRAGQRKGRRIPLTPRAIELMGPPSTGLVFRGERGGYLHNLQHAMARATKRTGLRDISFHCFRHESASRFMQKGGDLRTLMDTFGWSSLKMVERYTHSSFERAREIMGQKWGNPKLSPFADQTRIEEGRDDGMCYWPDSSPEPAGVIVSQCEGETIQLPKLRVAGSNPVARSTDPSKS